MSRERKNRENDFLSPAENEKFTRVLSAVNFSLSAEYPNVPPLDPSMINVLPDEQFARHITNRSMNYAHPVTLGILRRLAQYRHQKLVFYTENTESWLDQDTNEFYLAKHNLENLNNNPVKMLSLGIALATTPIQMAAQPRRIVGQEIKQYANNVLPLFTEPGLGAPVFRTKDIREMLEYIKDKTVALNLKGALGYFEVEGKMFGPQLATITEEAVIAYLAKPVRIRLVNNMCLEIGLSESETIRFRSVVQRISGGAVTFPLGTQSAEDALESLFIERGFWPPRDAILEHYLKSKLGAK